MDMELSRCINFLLSASQHAVFQYLSGRLAPHGITPAQYGVLNCLWKHGCLSPKQIGEILHLEASSVSGILERMQKNDLIERNIDPDNRRAILVLPTQKALDLQAPVEAIVTEMNQLVLESFTEEEKELIIRALTIISERSL